MTSDKPLNRTATVIIDRRYNGPIDSGNGGWMAGSLARLFGDVSVSVALRAPVPLAVPMCVRWRDDGTATLDDNGTLVAEAAVAPLELDVPIAPNPDEAEAAGVLAQQVSAQHELRYGQWEPCDMRVSRTVLGGALGETPEVYSLYGPGGRPTSSTSGRGKILHR